METEGSVTSRRSERISVSVPVTIIAKNRDGHRVSMMVSMLDVTEYGFRIRGGIALVPGQVVELIPNEGPAKGVGARVVWARLVPGASDAEFGLEFENSLSKETWTPPFDSQGR